MEIKKSIKNLWLIGNLLPNFNLKTNERPSKNNVLARLYYCTQVDGCSVAASSLIVANEVLVAYNATNTTKQLTRNIARKIIILRNKYRNLVRNKNSRSDVQFQKRNYFIENTFQCFDIKKMLNTSTGVNRESESTVPQPSTSGILVTKTNLFESSSETASQASESGHSISDFEIGSRNIKNQRLQKLKMQIVTKEVSAACDRAQISNRRAALIISATANSLGHNLRDVSVSAETVRRSRRKAREEINKEIRESFSDDTLLNVHWDGKLLPDLTGRNSTLDVIDRLAIIVSGNGITKLLAIPKLSSGTGEMMANKIYEILEQWNITNRIKGISFDTTASNTGRINGACQLLEEKLDRDLLWFACRHHIYELVISKVYTALLKDNPVCPEITLFKNFKKIWPQLNHNQFKNGICENKIYNAISDQKREIVEFIQIQLKYIDNGRDDYKECLQLCLIFLGESANLKIRRPGAISRARWMAKIIYCLKIYLFREQFSLKESEIEGLREFNIFVVKVYIKRWFTCTLSCSAPNNDLQFLKELNNYKIINSIVSGIALKTFANHLWYLSESLICLALFDRTLEDETKSAMIENLNKPVNMDKVKKTKINVDQINDIKLNHLVTQQSTIIFKSYFNCEMPQFLTKNPATWVKDKEYLKMEQILKKIEVVNDVAERGIALIKKFNGILTNQEEEKQLLLQVIEHHYKLFPKLTKSNIISGLKL